MTPICAGKGNYRLARAAVCGEANSREKAACLAYAGEFNCFYGNDHLKRFQMLLKRFS